jgi:hypothetical protein
MSTTGLGMPALPPRTAQPAWKQAWDNALYGPDGYLRRHPMTLTRDRAELVDFLAGRAGAHRSVVLLGAAGLLAPDLGARLPGVDLRPDLPARYDGLVVAVDWLAHVPTHVVRADDDGRPRIVHVDPLGGEEILGLLVSDAGVPATIGAWLERYWPLAEAYDRAEVGTAREAAWRDVVRRMAGGEAVALEPGHLFAHRPREGSLRAPDGRATLPDGSRDLVADVALDALADACEGTVVGSGALLRVEVHP